MKRIFAVVSTVVFVAFTMNLVLAQTSKSNSETDPRLGTWKLNLAKSKFEPGPAPKSEVRTYEASDNGVKLSRQRTDESGKSASSSYTAKYDGRDYPVTWDGIAAPYDAIALKRVDAHTVDAVEKKNGKDVTTVRSVVSNDGKTLTIKSKGMDVDGHQNSNNTAVYDKQ